MTVLGGLQFDIFVSILEKVSGFNTDDGIRRAAISARAFEAVNAGHVSIPMTVLGGLQFRPWRILWRRMPGFNADDGIRRAAIWQLSLCQHC